MSGAGGIRAGRAYVELYADGSKLNAGLKRAQERLRAFSSALRNVGASMVLTGAAMFTPFVLSVKKFMEAAKDGQLAGADLGKAITLHQAVNTTTKAIDQLQISVGAALAPSIVALSEVLNSLLGDLTTWARKNPGLVTGIAAISAGVVVLGGGLVVLGASINIAAFAFGGLATAATAALGVMSAGLAALVSPIALVTAGIVGLGAVLATQTQVGREAIAPLVKDFNRFKNEAVASWSAIGDAMATGDLGLAAKIGMKTVENEMALSWAYIKNLAIDSRAWILRAFLTDGTGIAVGWAKAMGAVESAIHSVVRTYREANTVMSGGIASMLAGAGESVGLLPQGTQAIAEATTMQALAAMQRTGDAIAEQIRLDLQRRMSDIAAQSVEMRHTLDAGLASFVNENNATVATLRKQLVDLRASAADGRKQLDEQMKAKGDQATAAAAAVTGRAPKADVFGTFSSAATFGIGIGSTAADRTANAAEKSAKELTAIREKIYTGQAATFGP